MFRFFLSASVAVSLFLILLSNSVTAQNGTVRGVVFDKETGEPLSFVNVYLRENLKGGVTNLDGFYNIENVVPGNYTLVSTFLGYDSFTIAITVAAGKSVVKNIYLKPGGINLGEVEISAEKQARTKEVQIGKTTITSKSLEQLATVGGEPELVQTLQVLPGVITTGDQGGQLFIRGGSPVMNKVLLDGLVIYNPFHSMGLFSVFDADIIKSTDVYSAGFGAQYGGRISAVVDVSMRDGARNQFGGKVAVNPFTSKILLEGPLKKYKEGQGSISYVLSYKNCYLAQSAEIFYPNIADRVPYTFSDLYGKLSFNSPSGSRFEAFGFDFRDRANFVGQTDFGWNSSGFGGRFVAIPEESKTLFTGFFGYTNYSIKQQDVGAPPRESSINGANVGLDFTYLMENSQLKYGTEINVFRTEYSTFNAANRKIEEIDNNTELHGYITYRLSKPRFVFEPGVRLIYYASLAEISVEPRLAAKYNVSSKFRLKGAAGIYTQNLVAAASDRDVVNLFYGFLAGIDNLPSTFKGEPVNSVLQRSQHLVGGFEFDPFKDLEIGAEAYIKNFGQITNINTDKIFPDVPFYSNRPEYQRKDFIVEDGKASGFDVSVKYNKKHFNTSVIYSYTLVTRDDGRRVYSPVFDRRHNINFLLNYNFGKSGLWDFNGRWNFGSPFPFTLTQGYYEFLNFQNGVGNNYPVNNGQLGIHYADLNTGRLPAFHRLDVSLKRKIPLTKTSEINLIASVVNVYNRDNIFFYNRATGTRVDQLPLLPSLGFNYKF